MLGGKRPIVFLLGPSGAGKSTLASWLAEDSALLHLEIDVFPNDGIDAAGLRAEWDPFWSDASASALVMAIQTRVAAAGTPGAVLSFPSTLFLTLTHLVALRDAGVTSLVLYGPAADCLDAFLAHEANVRRVNGDPIEHWLANNRNTYFAFSRPEFAFFRVAVFRNGARVCREDLVAEVQHRAVA
jgi:energy-coupling factor transporter ATP-binding protein EcfA2